MFCAALYSLVVFFFLLCLLQLLSATAAFPPSSSQCYHSILSRLIQPFRTDDNVFILYRDHHQQLSCRQIGNSLERADGAVSARMYTTQLLVIILWTYMSKNLNPSQALRFTSHKYSYTTSFIEYSSLQSAHGRRHKGSIWEVIGAVNVEDVD